MASFSTALIALKDGKTVLRQGWNGKNMHLELVQAYDVSCIDPEDLLPWIGMRTADKKFVPWLASQTDILAEDWLIEGV